ncbi:MAG: DUF1016 family protein [Deltaproteobacteria bacterium]|nr:DUF1016 family protein [Deltaproteobacteria bacterium]
MPSKEIDRADQTYVSFVREIKARVVSARIGAARAVNRELIGLYWDIGKGIVERQKKHHWGNAVVEMLAKDLQTEFPSVTGFSPRNLWDMRRLYATFSSPEMIAHVAKDFRQRKGLPILQQAAAEFRADEKSIQAKTGLSELKIREFLPRLVAEIPWGHHRFLLDKINDPAALLYYIQATAQFGWSRNVLLNQIKAQAYERARLEKKTHNFPAVLPDYFAEQADEALKSSYNLEFLGIKREVKERELEDRLIEQLRDFILELGYGFCFVGRQYRLSFGDNEYFIDLLFYHRFLKSLVAFELKVGGFKPEYAGKMDFYLNVLNKSEKAPDDNPSIGIILCAQKDDMVVEFSLQSKTNPIGVAEYHLTKRLPREFKGKLPTEKELRTALLMEPQKGM